MKPNPSISDYRDFRRTIVGAVIALIVLIIGFSAWKAVVECRLTIRAAEQLTRGYARALREHAERTFSEADTVLLVEDNQMVREMTKEMLESAGFTVLTSAEPGTAIGLLTTGSA